MKNLDKGETIIVSEGYDISDIDLETMIVESNSNNPFQEQQIATSEAEEKVPYVSVNFIHPCKEDAWGIVFSYLPSITHTHSDMQIEGEVSSPLSALLIFKEMIEIETNCFLDHIEFSGGSNVSETLKMNYSNHKLRLASYSVKGRQITIHLLT